MLSMIVSGGQTGADRTGLEVAKSKGIPTGGWVPRGCRTDEGPDKSLITEFGCKETASDDYPTRTKMNVANSDGTVWFGNVGSPGGRLTKKIAEDLRKPFLINPDADELAEWIEEFGIEVLNVAGNRKRTNPEVVNQVHRVLGKAIDLVVGVH